MTWAWYESNIPNHHRCGCCGKIITTRGRKRHEDNCRRKALALQSGVVKGRYESSKGANTMQNVAKDGAIEHEITKGARILRTRSPRLSSKN